LYSRTFFNSRAGLFVTFQNIFNFERDLYKNSDIQVSDGLVNKMKIIIPHFSIYKFGCLGRDPIY